ncbi:MAG: hypothetical protein L6R40_005846 [Gallowayella cf. fulva]|nr:MAG: hypothetical protein L6R40_005846 [Xanthomendoza cf. fulva]
MVFVSRRKIRLLRYLLLAVTIFLLLDFFSCVRRTYPTLRTTSSVRDLKNTKSVYIASTQWNSGQLLQEHWIPNLVQVVKDLKSANIKVFISIYENGSWDSTKPTLEELRRTLDALGIQNRITLDDKSHKDIIGHNETASGWLRTAHGIEMRRIPYLANVRNEALKPLHDLTASGERFDKLIFLNDVIFSPSDLWTLLNTQDGKYAAACALDFLNPPWNHVEAQVRGHHPPGMYDDFATRDSAGNVLGSHLFPYFSSALSKKAVISGHDVPVQSCWNGLGIAFDAFPFQKPEDPLKFRGIPDSLAQYHVEASECCIIHYDNPLTSRNGVYINPAVRVAYSAKAYAAVSSSDTANAKALDWPTSSELRWGHWKSRWLWWARWPASTIKVWWRIRKWKGRYPDVVEPDFFDLMPPCAAPEI